MFVYRARPGAERARAKPKTARTPFEGADAEPRNARQRTELGEGERAEKKREQALGRDKKMSEARRNRRKGEGKGKEQPRPRQEGGRAAPRRARRECATEGAPAERKRGEGRKRSRFLTASAGNPAGGGSTNRPPNRRTAPFNLRPDGAPRNERANYGSRYEARRGQRPRP